MSACLQFTNAANAAINSIWGKFVQQSRVKPVEDNQNETPDIRQDYSIKKQDGIKENPEKGRYAQLENTIDVIRWAVKSIELTPAVDEYASSQSTAENRYCEPDWQKTFEKMYRERRFRDSVFGDFAIFHDPAWDILLDIAIAEHKGIRLPVSSVCIGACVPATTALRWLSLLEDKGLVYREDDLLDGRRAFVRLTAVAIQLMRSVAVSSGIVTRDESSSGRLNH